MIPSNPGLTRRGKWDAPNFSWAKGPKNWGQLGNGSYSTRLGSNWLLLINELNKFELWQYRDDEWALIEDIPGMPPNLPDAARHPALAFDKFAMPVIAWERSNLQNIRVHQLDVDQSVIGFGFSGVDPILLNTEIVTRQAADYKLLMYHLDRGRTRVRKREANFAWANPETLHTEAVPIYLDTIEIGYRVYYLHAGDDDNRRYRYSSGLYPVHLSDIMIGDSQFMLTKHQSSIDGTLEADSAFTSVMNPVKPLADVLEGNSHFVSVKGVA